MVGISRTNVTGGSSTSAINTTGRQSFSGAEVAPGRAQQSPSQGSVGAPVSGNNAITSSAYGRPIPQGFGTMRQSGNVIWALPIDRQEDALVQQPGGAVDSRDGSFGGGLRKSTGGSGSGGSVGGQTSSLGLTGSTSDRVVAGSVATEPTRTYSDYATLAVMYGRGVANDVLRIWMDDQIVFDKTGNKVDIETPGLIYRFYRGTNTQLQDPAIVADKGVDDTPAYRNRVYIVFEGLNLEPFGGRVPNIEAEILYSSTESRPVVVSTQIDGAVNNITTALLAADWNRNYLYVARAVTGDGIRRVNLHNNVEDKQITVADAISSAPIEFNNQGPNLGVMGDGSLMVSIGRGSNSQPVVRLDPDTLQETARFGFESVSTTNANNRFVNNRRFVPISLRTNDGAMEHYALCLASFTSQAGILSIPDLGFVWRDNLVPGQAIDGSRIRGACRGAVIDGLGEAWILSGPTYNVESGADNFLYRIRVFQGAKHDVTEDAVNGVIISLEATFNVADFSPGETLLRETGCLVYDQHDDSVIICVEDGSFQNRLIKYRPREGGILWRTGVLNSVPAFDTSGIESAPISESFLAGNRFGWVDRFGNGSLIDTVTGEILLNHDGAPFSPVFDGPGVYDSRSDTYTCALNDGASGEPAIRYLLNRAVDSGASIADIITTIVTGTELEVSDIDVSDVTSLLVPGYIIDSQVTRRQAIERLTDLFLVDSFESDFQIKFKRRNQSAVRTIPEDDFALLGNNTPDNFRRSEIQETDLPRRYTISYLDSTNDYHENTHPAQRVKAPTPTMNSRNNLGVDLRSVAMSPTVAKQRAEEALYGAWNERYSYEVNLPWTHIDLDPTDVVNFTLDSGLTYTARFDQIDVGNDFSLETNSIDQEGGIASTVAADGGDKLDQVLKTSLAVRTVLLDIPLIDASLNDPSRQDGLIWGIQGSYADGQFTLGIIQRDLGTEFNTVVINTSGMQWGVVTSALGDPPDNNPFTLDTINTMTVSMVAGGSTLQSITFTELFEQRAINRAALLKANGEVEIVRFQNVTQNTDGTYTFDTFVRGHSGTDTMTTGHANGDLFILFSTTLGESFNLPLAARNIAFDYRGLGEFQILQSGDIQSFTSEHRSLKPYAPTNLTVALDGSNNIDFAWKRRDRVSQILTGGSDNIALNEDSEAYEIDILDGPGGNVARAVTGLTSPSYEYLNADIITDFGSVPSQISVRVYQISAQVGRGFTHEVTRDVE